MTCNEYVVFRKDHEYSKNSNLIDITNIYSEELIEILQKKYDKLLYFKDCSKNFIKYELEKEVKKYLNEKMLKKVVK